MERDNRKSHLAPQLSPATQDLLRSTDSPTFFNQTITAASDERSMQTPTSGEIPIMGTIGSSRDQYSAVHRVPERSANRSPPPARSGGGEAAAVGERPGRAGGSPVHPRMGPRVSTNPGAIPQQQQRTRETMVSVGGPRSAGRVPATFTLPVRPGGGGGSGGGFRPPPPPRKETAEERRESSRRQAAFGPPVPQAEGVHGYGSYAHQ
jgi:mitogen-activated protein kinase kinase